MKVDVVYAWVDGRDPVWKAKKEKFGREHSNQNKIGLLPEKSGVAEAASSEIELLYSISSVKKYMPWINQIFIVTDDQIPHETIKKHPEVIIVYHKDIFPKHAKLPVFNPPPIELSFINIKGLSEFFIYMNDDYFINKPMFFEDFYRKNKSALFIEKFFTKFSVTPNFLFKSGIHRGQSTRSRLFTNHVLTESYGPCKRYLLQHAPTLVICDQFLLCQKKFQTYVDAVYQRQFPCSNDIAPLCYLYPYYLLHNDLAFFNPEVLNLFIPVTNHKKLNDFLYKKVTPELHHFCLNDLRTKTSLETINQMENFLKKTLMT